MTLSTALGCVYYQSTDGNVTQFKIVRYIDEKKVEVKYEDGHKEKMLIDDITNNWYLLQPDGYINFSIVEINGLNDVVVTMVKYDDIESGMPWCVCRQNINDIFEQYIDNSNRYDGVIISGVSISQESIPAGMNLLSALAGDKLVKTTMVAAYNTDKLEDILQCIKVKQYDKVLEVINEIKIDSVGIPFIKKVMSERESYAGCHKTLRGLLIDNNFMYDVYRGFNMYMTDNITIDEHDIVKGNFNDGAVIDPGKLVIIEKVYASRLNNAVLVNYTKSFDLDQYENAFIIVDKNHNKFVVIYNSKNTLYEEENKLSPDERLRKIMQ